MLPITNYKPLIMLAGLTVISGCTHVVPVTGSIPTPVVASQPLSVGIFMDEAFRTFTHSEKRGGREEWVIESGRLNEEMFTNLFNSMFERTTILDKQPETGVGRKDLDATLQIKVTEYGFLTPRDTGQKFFAVSFKYQLLLWDPDGNLVASWPVVGYGKSPWSAFRDEVGLRNATAIAIRDGAATIALGFDKVPPIAEWLASKHSENETQVLQAVD